jgi:hypothetical protein
MSISYSVFVYSLVFLARKVHASYYIVIYRLSCCTFFPHYLINGTTFGKKYLT